MGARLSYTDELADAICERIADGESLRSICKSEGMPAMSAVFRWLSENKTFEEQYVRARAAQADVLFDEIVHIADTPVEGVKTKTKDDGSTETQTGDMIEHRRLQVEARKWVLGRMQPKKYGDKIDIEQRTTHEVGGSVKALMQEIADAGRKITD